MPVILTFERITLFCVQSPGILIPCLDIFALHFGVFGYLNAMLEPHLKAAGFTINEVGIVFLTMAAAYVFGTFCTSVVRYIWIL